MERADKAVLPRSVTGRRDVGKLTVRIALFSLVAMIMRFSTFGDPTIWVDEQFYFVVGQRMVDGELPYVDIWDRKPPGLFLAYSIFALFSRSVLVYQLAAFGFIVATAEIIARLGACRDARRGGCFAGVLYIVMLNCFAGYGGQAQLFYNLFVAAGALLTISSLDRLRTGEFPPATAAAMLLFGLAISFKQTTIAEVAYFGLLVAGTARSLLTAFKCIALGIIPMSLLSLPFIPHWPEYWTAMVTSNLTKSFEATGAEWILVATARMLIALITAALLGLVLTPSRIVSGWIVAAIIGFFLVPRFYPHYALPLLVPLCVAAASLFELKVLGPIALAVASMFTFYFQWPFDLAYHQRSRQVFEEFTAAIKATGGSTMLLYDGPTELYNSTGFRHLSPLVFPQHWNHLIEADVSHLKTSDEMKRVLAQRPDVVVMFPSPRNFPINEDTLRQVRAYLAECRLAKRGPIYEAHRTDVIDVWNCMPEKR